MCSLFNLLTYDVTVYDICIERPICYLRIAWGRFLILNKELFCSVLYVFISLHFHGMQYSNIQCM